MRWLVTVAVRDSIPGCVQTCFLILVHYVWASSLLIWAKLPMEVYIDYNYPSSINKKRSAKKNGLLHFPMLKVFVLAWKGKRYQLDTAHTIPLWYLTSTLRLKAFFIPQKAVCQNKNSSNQSHLRALVHMVLLLAFHGKQNESLKLHIIAQRFEIHLQKVQKVKTNSSFTLKFDICLSPLKVCPGVLEQARRRKPEENLNNYYKPD